MARQNARGPGSPPGSPGRGLGTAVPSGACTELDLLPLLEALLDVRNAAEGAELFHGTLAAALAEWLAGFGCERVVLGGGCFVNRVLTEALIEGLAARGVTALLARAAPTGDGGLALGQARVAAESLG